MSIGDQQLDLLWQKTLQPKVTPLDDVFAKTAQMKLQLSKSFQNIRQKMDKGKLPQGDTQLLPSTQKQKEQSSRWDRPFTPKPRKDPVLSENEYFYRIQFQQRMQSKKNQQKFTTKLSQTKEQRSKQALTKLTVYDLPRQHAYKHNQIAISGRSSTSPSMKLIVEDDNVCSGFNFRKEIFKQLAVQGVLKKQVLCQYLKTQTVICQLYSISKENLESCIGSIKTANPGCLSELELHQFLTNRNRSVHVPNIPTVCVLSDQQWMLLRSFYSSLDVFGRNDVLKAKIMSQMSKKSQVWKHKLFMKDCILFPDVQRRLSFGRIWEQLLTRPDKDYWSWDDFRKAISEFGVGCGLNIDQIPYNHYYPKTYNFIVEQDFISMVKWVFSKQMAYYDRFVSLNSVSQSLRSHSDFSRHSSALVRTNPINGLPMQTVSESLDRMVKDAPEYLDLDEVLIHFSFNGMFDQDIYFYQLSLYDKAQRFTIDYDRKKKAPKPKKAADITVPVQFKFSQNKSNIRQKRVEEMVRQNQQEEMKEVINKFKAIDLPVTNGPSYNRYQGKTAETHQREDKKTVVYSQITMDQLKQYNDERREFFRVQTMEKYGIPEWTRSDISDLNSYGKDQKVIVTKKYPTVPQPFCLSSPKPKPPPVQTIYKPQQKPNFEAVLESMKKQIEVPMTRTYQKCLQLQRTKAAQEKEIAQHQKQEKRHKQMRKKEFSKFMSRSLPKIITTGIRQWRDHEIKKEFREIQKRLAHQNEEEISQMYRRVLNRPFLFQGVPQPRVKVRKAGTRVKNIKRRKVCKVSHRPKLQTPTKPQCDKSNLNYQSTVAPHSNQLEQHQYPSQFSDGPHQTLMIHSNQVPKIPTSLPSNMFGGTEVDSQQQEEFQYQQQNQQGQQEGSDQYQHQYDQQDQYQQELEAAPMRHSF